MIKLTTFPYPASNTILGTQCLVDKCLLSQRFLEIMLPYTFLNLVLDDGQCLIHVGHIYLLIKKLAEVFHGCLEHQIFGNVLCKCFLITSLRLQIFESRLLLNLNNQPINRIPYLINFICIRFVLIKL